MQLTKPGWTALFQAWGIDREMELQAAEDKALNDASDAVVRAMLGAGSSGTPSAAAGMPALPGATPAKTGGVLKAGGSASPAPAVRQQAGVRNHH